MFFLEAVPATISSHTCSVEYSDHLTTFSVTAIPLCVLLLIHSHACDYCLCNNFATTTSWFHTLCCLHSVSGRRTFQSNARCCGNMCSHSVVITATIGPILTLLVLYELMLLVQVQIETGVKGIVLSLLPSFPLSALGWYLTKRSQKRSLKDLKEEQLIPEEYLIQQTDNSSYDLILL